MAKGVDIGRITRERIRWIENWMNTYPRKIIDFDAAEERFNQEIAA